MPEGRGDHTSDVTAVANPAGSLLSCPHSGAALGHRTLLRATPDHLLAEGVSQKPCHVEKWFRSCFWQVGFPLNWGTSVLAVLHATLSNFLFDQSSMGHLWKFCSNHKH